MADRPDVTNAAANGRAFWRALFGNTAPVEIEIGSGDGAFLLASARRRSDRNFLGIERSPSKAKRLAARVAALGSPHVRVVQGDATCVLASCVPAASVTAFHVYFPDPWPKRGHARRRIFQPSFVAAMARALRADGRVFVATDVAGYAAIARAQMLEAGGFRELDSGAQHPGLTTSFARKYRAAGRRLHVFTFELTRVPAEACGAAASKIRST